MVNYTCPRCLKEFNRKSSFTDHTENKKKPCKLISSNTLQVPPKTHQVPPETHQVPPETHQNITQIIKNNSDHEINNTSVSKNNKGNKIDKITNSCVYCGLIFTRKDALKRHMDSRCKVKILDNEHKEKTFELLIKENKYIKKENQDIKKELEQIKKQIETQLNKVHTQNINKGNITNNIVIPQSMLTDFGKEDYEKINIKKILNSIKDSGVNGIINCFNDIHYNEEVPQYKNVFITDKSRDKGMVYEDGQWRVKTIKYIVGEIMTHIERYVRIIEKRIKSGKYKDILDPEDPDKKKKINIKEFKEKMESRLKKYILRYYGDDEETTPKASKQFSDMVFKYVSNRLFDVRDGVYRNYEKVLEDIQKDSSDPEIKKINEEKKLIIQSIDNLKDDIKKEIKEDIGMSNNYDDDEDEEDEDNDDYDDQDDNVGKNKTNMDIQEKEPVYVQKTITLASGLKKQVWINENTNIEDYYNF